MIRTLVFAALLGAPAAGAYARDLPLAKGYAVASATAVFASGHCAGIGVDDAGLAALASAAGIGDADDAWLAGEINHARPAIENAFQYEGAREWCGTAWTLFGPPGLGVIRRQD